MAESSALFALSLQAEQAWLVIAQLQAVSMLGAVCCACGPALFNMG